MLGFQVARRFHPRRCSSLGCVVMFDLHPRFYASLWGVSCGVVVCLNIFAKLLISYNLLVLMNKNGDVGSGFLVASI